MSGKGDNNIYNIIPNDDDDSSIDLDRSPSEEERRDQEKQARRSPSLPDEACLRILRVIKAVKKFLAKNAEFNDRDKYKD